MKKIIALDLGLVLAMSLPVFVAQAGGEGIPGIPEPVFTRALSR
jgi:hypothetical protein